MAEMDDLRRVFTDEDTFATVLLTVFIDRYPAEALNWAPLTIRMEIEDDIAAPVPPAVFDRFMAGLYLISSDDFYWRLPRFIVACNVLSGSPWTPDVLDLATVREMAWGVTEAALLQPPTGFSPDILLYVDRMLAREGFLTVPTALRQLVGPREIDYGPYPAEQPLAFAAEFEAQREKTEDVDEAVRADLARLFGELESLSLRHGDPTNLISRFRKSLNA